MARNAQRDSVLSELRRSPAALSVAEISRRVGPNLPHRTLRRWLSKWVAEGDVTRTGVGRATRYQSGAVAGADTIVAPLQLEFLRGLDSDIKRELLAQIRDLWTHTSTALEGNALTLGDTHFILNEGLTISGRPVKDHQEVIGHAHAIDLLYQCLNEPLTETIIFEFHKAVQTGHVRDIYKPNGAWKVEPNGTHAITADGGQVFIEYAIPSSVPVLMSEIIEYTNAVDVRNASLFTVHECYARIHMGIVHVHPFWDGNGRIARLLANIPLLKAGLPPLTIPDGQRRAYIQQLADYQVKVGQLNASTGVWPDLMLLSDFNSFCEPCYSEIRSLVEAVFDVQKKRNMIGIT